MKKIALIGSLLFASPLAVFAQGARGNTNFLDTLGVLTDGLLSIARTLIPLLIAIAIVVFFWGLIKYIRASGEGHKDGQNIMIAGLISLFVMVSLWGIIALAQGTFGVGGTAPFVPPSVRKI